MKKLPADLIYYIRTAVWEFNSGLIFTSIWVLLYTVMGLSLVEVSILYIVITISNFVLEIPTGVLADVYSRRLSVIVGGVFIGLTYVLMGTFPLFAVALLGGFIEAIGDTCVSGALQAWITDEVGEAAVGKVFLRGRQVATPAHWAGVLLSIAMAALLNYQAPIILGGALWFVLTIFLVLFMPETNFQRTVTIKPGGKVFLDPLKASFAIFADGMQLVRGSRILQALFIAQLLSAAFFDGFYKFSRAHVLQSFALPTLTLPLLGALKDNVWFGILEMLQGLFCLLGAEVIRRRVQLDKSGAPAGALLVIHSVMLVALCIFAFTGHFGLTLVLWVLVSGLQELGQPITEAWLNLNIPSKVRATVISMSSQTGMVGTLGSSTGLGAFGDRFGVRSALGLLNLLLLPLVWIYGRNARGLMKLEQVAEG
ncbi:MAG: MFS transporter [Anaerolineae bacterium]|nr:MFS transporter [Anaerolineae bacterium]